MIKSKLQITLDEIGITSNKLAVESKTRPTTVYSLVKNEMSSLKFDTLNTLLDTINDIAIEKGLNKQYTITDIIDYEYTKKS